MAFVMRTENKHRLIPAVKLAMCTPIVGRSQPMQKEALRLNPDTQVGTFLV